MPNGLRIRLQALAQIEHEVRIRSAVAAHVQDVTENKPLDLNITREWFEKRSALEGDHEIGAGRRKLTASIDPTPEELYELYRIAHRIPEGWQLVPIKPTKDMAYAAACAHYGKKRVDQTGIEGISMTVNNIDYNFSAAFRRFWKGALAAAPAKQECATDAD
ncbi:hypothetical protein CFBP5507_06125 [Agrobacterium salinitolerans]|uniref:Uncharacterized protein n=1 Tax=Agrobacterium salinitolerans TaxID=1183413 RepID=A0A4Z1QZ49_9HYPH|nr:hypothetical protein [Agrobacterium salinitolerans]UYZ08576.1 hypothetical protein CFBP5507_06125 [Agrobacterium salinitolerans]